jgi:hypothetical protein
VIGDSCSDIDAATNVPHRHAISIGFLNGKEIHNDSAVRHLQTYDAIVLGHDGSLEPVDALIDELANRDPTLSSPRIKRMFKIVAEEQKREVAEGNHPTRVHGDRN